MLSINWSDRAVSDFHENFRTSKYPPLPPVQAFTRAMELDPQRLYSKVQRGYIYLSLGAYPEAITAFEASIEQSPRFGPACEGIATALLASARSHQRFGAPGAAHESPCSGQA